MAGTSKADALRIIRRRCPAATIRHNPNAADDARRAEIKAERDLLVAEEERLRKQALAMKPDVVRESLAKAARFVCDVNGDDPSIGQLRDAIANADKIAEIDERLAEIDARKKQMQSERLVAKYELVKPYTIPGMGTGVLHVASADTIDELLSKFCK